jgi:hypothetical protein
MLIFSARGPSLPRQPYKLGQDIFYLHHQFDVDLPHRNFVSCLVMMDDGRIVFSTFYKIDIFCDFMLLIYNIDGSHEDSIPLESISCGITAIDNSTVAVTSYDTIDMYDINNKVKLKSIVLHNINFLLHFCQMSNITTINNNLVVGVLNSILIIDRQTGEVVKTIDTGGISTWCLHGTSDKIFYCDYLLHNNNNIYCYNYSDDQVDIKTLPSPPHSITSLQDGSVYVVCENGSVQHVSSDGKSYKTVTTEGLLSLKKPSVISYNPKQRKLVTCSSKGMVKVFDEV